MRHMFRPWAFAALGAALVGCTSARYVTVEPDGGVVAIPSNSETWPFNYRADAEKLMAKKCPEGYVIDHEGEVDVGTTTRVNTHNDTTQGRHGSVGETSEQQTTVTRVKEWQITFHGKNSDPAARPVTQASYVTPSPLPGEPVPVRSGQ